ncbi:hypothetical protein DPEC_G00355010 [Dallia pectoralis]|uniref:Uncharacterized protein n=1 Tax=Dallia pectoralis TaxID=75939 RepID=A0ACC2EZG5_DALPE|nr:hypothetical protein DPEC_G00355010 [Dallia pectoralis]
MPSNPQHPGLDPHAVQGGLPSKSQNLGFSPDAEKSLAKYGNPGAYQPQPIEPDAVVNSAGQHEYGELPLDQTVGLKGEDKSSGIYGNRGYLNGQVQAEVTSNPSAPTSFPSIPHTRVPLFVPLVSSFPSEAPSAPGLEASPEPAGTPALSVVSALPQTSHQIHIQQHLKLHIQPQSKSWTGGAKEKKYELTGFLGNGRYQG